MNHVTKDRIWLTAGAEIEISIVAHRFATKYTEFWTKISADFKISQIYLPQAGLKIETL